MQELIQINKDLRDLNEEEFRQVYGYVKERTMNFNEVKSEFLRENPQFLLIIRLVMGLSQLEFSKELGTTNKQWVRHFEAGRQGYKHSKLFNQALQLINSYFRNKQVVDYDRSFYLWQKTKAARGKYTYDYPKAKFKIKRFTDMTREEFIEAYSLLKSETNNFSCISKELFMQTPIFISVFRIILGISVENLCKLMDFDTRRIRKYESFTERMLPETAENFVEFFRKLKQKKNLNLEIALSHFDKFNLFTGMETDIINTLNKEGFTSYRTKIPENYPFCVKSHTKIKSIRKDINVDFIIPSEDKPIVVIEATELTRIRKRIDITQKVSYIDHRFQLLKLKHSKLKTILVFNCFPSQRELVKRTIKNCTVNTDFYFINKIKKLPTLLRKIIENKL